MADRLISTDFMIRFNAEAEIKQLSEEQKKALVPPLIESLRHGKEYLPGFAANALGKIGPAAKDAAPAFTAALKDQDTRVRKAAHEALRRIGANRDAASIENGPSDE